jgi:zinc transporter ZupT
MVSFLANPPARIIVNLPELTYVCTPAKQDNDMDASNKMSNLQMMAQEMKDYKQKKKDRNLCLIAGVPKAAVDENKYFEGIKEQEEKRRKNDKMMRMSYKTAFVVALHNFPEGLATFVAALGNPKMGLVLSIGIALHNIPEGLAVALPLYYATGNRTKAFLLGTLSGCTEIIAALLGWAVLASVFSPALYLLSLVLYQE